jgi:hypothetical protein
MHWQREGQHDSDTRFEAMKTRRINPQPTSALRLHTPVLPQLPERLRRFVNAASVAHGGAESMTLSDWRDLELELKRRLENEQQ